MSEHPDRRTVLKSAGALGAAGVAAGALAGCGSSSTTTPATSAPAAGTSPGAAATSGAGTAVPVSQVPVGGGVVLSDAKLVVTQPVAGQYKAFTAVCPHQGCTVSKVDGGVISCPCHGSTFDAESGAVKSGPARTGLSAKTATVSGSTVTVT